MLEHKKEANEAIGPHPEHCREEGSICLLTSECLKAGTWEESVHVTKMLVPVYIN